MREIELFKKKYKDVMEREVFKVEYFGSTEDCRRWSKGDSDLDISVDLPSRTSKVLRTGVKASSQKAPIEVIVRCGRLEDRELIPSIESLSLSKRTTSNFSYRTLR